MAERAAVAWRRERRGAAVGGEAGGSEGEGEGGLFDGGQETSRVMNFSAGCIRGVTRTRTGVRKQVVADICSARGPGCPCHPPLPLSLPSSHPHPPSLPQRSLFLTPPSLPQCCRPEPDCWIVSRCRRETERQKMRVKQFFSFFLWSHI